MKPKPTPGPWTVDQFGWCAESETWENQYLIAAAPELLEACKFALDVVHETDIPFGAGNNIGTILRAAIRKAEGNDE